MGNIKAKAVFGISWCDQHQVIELARKLGKGQCVIKYIDRQNYNITHKSTLNDPRVKRAKFFIIYQT